VRGRGSLRDFLVQRGASDEGSRLAAGEAEGACYAAVECAGRGAERRGCRQRVQNRAGTCAGCAVVSSLTGPGQAALGGRITHHRRSAVLFAR
jgi:hypothetical protein